MIRLGALCWSQSTDWKALGEAGIRADRLAYDSLWTWDHLMAISGPPTGRIFEGWMTLAAWAATTERIRIGLLVGANTFRNPALVAKLATTLDHISHGRATLGIGGAWFEREHRLYGLDFGDSVGERLRRLDEAVRIVREMLHGEAAHGESYYAPRGARLAPAPIQARLPILIGGAGERRTLRTVARYADAWNLHGPPERVVRKDAVMRRHCLEVGRDESEIERTVSVGVVVLRDNPREAGRVFRSLKRSNGIRGRYALRASIGGLVRRDHPRMWRPDLVGTPAQVAERLRPYLGIGFRHLIAGFPAPYDAETMERLVTEVRPLLEANSDPPG